MNQNIFGAFLFSGIVGTAILLNLYFTPLPKPLPVYETPVYQENYRPLGCNKNRVINQTTPAGLATIKVRQAVLNHGTHKLTTEYLIRRDNQNTSVIRISLHFFTKDGRATRYLATESITIQPEFDQNGNAEHSVISSFQWLDDLKQRDNLYVIAESGVQFDRRATTIVFNPAIAAPVLLH